MHALLLIHRYLGLGFGALILLWCGSGVVTMYVTYPKLAESRRLRALTPLDWSSAPLASKLPSDLSADGRLEMLAGRPVLSQRSRDGARIIDLATGRVQSRVSVAQATAVAAAYAPAGWRPRIELLGTNDLDQWTVSGQFAVDRPLYHFALGDDDGSELYVSSSTGRLVQATTRKQRFWNWLGPIPHWLYWVQLRQRPELWTQVVIVGALGGALLTVSGLWLGLRRLPERPAGSAQRARAWHRLNGLIFALFTLTWLGTGLLTVQPWGLLESPVLADEQLHGRAPSPTQIEQAVRAFQTNISGRPFVSVEINHADIAPFLVASTADGQRTRFDATGRPAPLVERDFENLARRLGSAQPATRLLEADDDLVAAHVQAAALPVYRVLLPGGERRALYLDAASGALLAQIDRNARILQWLEGVHRVDLLPLLRRRPLWDGLLWALLSGIAVLCGTGVWLGYRRLFVR